MQEVGQLVFAYIRLLQAVGGVTEERCSLQTDLASAFHVARILQLADQDQKSPPLGCCINAITKCKQHVAMLHYQDKCIESWKAKIECLICCQSTNQDLAQHVPSPDVKFARGMCTLLPQPEDCRMRGSLPTRLAPSGQLS